MNIEQEITKIQERNKKVELDKSWEVSLTRRITICALTYLFILAFSYFVNIGANILLSSAVPVIGFALSTASLPIVRKIWERGIK
ncbi:MAG: hypothetical protein LBM38_03555 [Clostridiales bacterium]|jgi:hypothetical protein|nr:hypothetical protein [Clostridiales bacterium]